MDAFPNPRYVNGQLFTGQSGLTKREYFAAKAMQATVTALPEWEKLGYVAGFTKEEIAAEAVAQADALIAALEEKA